MREHRFRGKTKDNGEWVYGSMYRLGEELNPFIMLINKCGESHEVDPSTVGQFTGLTDKNGREIYEGDIVSEKDFHGVVYLFGEQPKKNIAVKYEVGAVLGKRAGFTLDLDVAKGVYDGEVIGNVTDNPKLLKETEGKNEA